MIRGGIFGISMSGKTTLAKQLCLVYWKNSGIRSFVLDLNGETWGDHCLTTDNEDEFWQRVWKTNGSLIVVDEGSSTIQRDSELIPVFTRLRHLNHKLLVIGHRGSDLLPVMREQFDTLYLFRQPEKSALIWSEVFAEPRLSEASQLNQYEYLYCRLYAKPTKHKLIL